MQALYHAHREKDEEEQKHLTEAILNHLEDMKHPLYLYLKAGLEYDKNHRIESGSTSHMSIKNLLRGKEGAFTDKIGEVYNIKNKLSPEGILHTHSIHYILPTDEEERHLEEGIHPTIGFKFEAPKKVVHALDINNAVDITSGRKPNRYDEDF